ncbi:MAG: RNA pseudouridine synthase [Planctomycetota bacterium]|nr:MAG: RNA pseudouridine synthase [Planctomycetota bacterium]REJ90965.1 MAG: RNA pseudouridine synthase [Planctomycetota bacterium]
MIFRFLGGMMVLGREDRWTRDRGGDAGSIVSPHNRGFIVPPVGLRSQSAPRTWTTSLMAPPRFDVLLEDNHLLVISKPVGLPTMGVSDDRPTALNLAKEYIREQYNKPGNVYLGIVSRLDAPTSGALLIARTSKAAARLTEQFRRGSVTKQYWALVEGRPPAQETLLRDWVRKDERHRKMHLCNETAPGAQEARLTYRRTARVGDASLVEVELLTGRKHQIRVQLAGQGQPIVGDRKYGAKLPFAEGIALHARRLVFEHPVRREPVEVIAPLPRAWEKYGVSEAS